VAGKVIAGLRKRSVLPASARVLVLGATFKENCPDMRNSRAIDLAKQIAAAVAAVDVCDPWADSSALDSEPGLHRIETPSSGDYDAVVLAVAHDQYRAYDIERIRALGKPGAYVYDVKSMWPREAVDGRL
jgi:UDP-N-acetyl-D-galactosamine dehydrogenase